MIDPNHENTINLINNTIYDSESRTKKWDEMINGVLNEIETLEKGKKISKSDCDFLTELLKDVKSYKQLITAAHYMWLLARELANKQLSEKGHVVELTSKALRIYYYKGVPEIKAWVSDKKTGAFGGYDLYRLGVTNPIDFYKDSKNCQLNSFLQQSKYLLSESVIQQKTKEVIKSESSEK